jgi:hypothetical protein
MEIRTDGLYVVYEILGKRTDYLVSRGWHVLFIDGQGIKRLGYIQRIDLESRQLLVLDDVQYPDAPSPIGAQGELVAFEAVLHAADGYMGAGKPDVYEAKRKIGKRDVHVLWRADVKIGDIGWIARREGRAYVDLVAGKWQLRPDAAEKFNVHPKSVVWDDPATQRAWEALDALE